MTRGQFALAPQAAEQTPLLGGVVLGLIDDEGSITGPNFTQTRKARLQILEQSGRFLRRQRSQLRILRETLHQRQCGNDVVIAPRVIGQGIQGADDFNRIATAHDSRTSSEQEVARQRGDVVEFVYPFAHLQFVQQIEQRTVAQQEILQMASLLLQTEGSQPIRGTIGQR